MIQGSPNGEMDNMMTTSRDASFNSHTTSVASRGDSLGNSNPENTSGSAKAFKDGGNSADGLTTEAKAAIRVTIPVVAVLTGLANFMFFCVRRKRLAKADGELQGSNQQSSDICLLKPTQS
ncbi:hypothetical protein V2A60_001601 [Cordyceps javanica]